MRAWTSCVSLVAALAIAASTPASASEEADRAAIAAAVQGWAAAFNAADATAACALFAPDVVSITPEAPEAGRDAVCGRLRAVLARSGLRLHYAVEIREIILAGDLAVVRLFWTLTAQRMGQPSESTREAGLDVFRRGPDGRWAIARFMAFEVAPPTRR